MAWPSDRVLSLALRELLSLIGREYLWTEDGPTEQAVAAYRRGSPMSSGERVLFLAAFGLWNADNKKATFGEVALRLDRRLLDALLSLVIACHVGEEAVERWIADGEARRGRGPATPLEHALLRALIEREPPGEDILGWLIARLPGASIETILGVWRLFIRGTFGEIEASGDEKTYPVEGGTLTTTPHRLRAKSPAGGSGS